MCVTKFSYSIFIYVLVKNSHQNILKKTSENTQKFVPRVFPSSVWVYFSRQVAHAAAGTLRREDQTSPRELAIFLGRSVELIQSPLRGVSEANYSLADLLLCVGHARVLEINMPTMYSSLQYSTWHATFKSYNTTETCGVDLLTIVLRIGLISILVLNVVEFKIYRRSHRSAPSPHRARFHIPHVKNYNLNLTSVEE